jgi:cytosine deaminase
MKQEHGITTVLRRGMLTTGDLVDIHINDGMIHAITPAVLHLDDGHDLGGRLVLPAFTDTHVHLDKARTAPLAPANAVGLMGAIDAHIRILEMGHYDDEEEVIARCRATLDRLLLAGVLSVRAQLNAGDGVGLRHIELITEAAEPYRQFIDLQITAMVHTPLTGSDGASNRAALAAALEFGVDVVGGCPHLDPDPIGMIDILFAAASEAGVPIDLHTDETLDPTMFTLPHMIELTERFGLQGRVAASHCVSLSMQTEAEQHRTAQRLAEAGVAVVALPQTNLFLNAYDTTSAPARGIAPVSVLEQHGVVVASGSDNVQDPFNPVGSTDPLLTAAMLVMASHQLPPDALRQVSTAGRAVMGLTHNRVESGGVADLVALTVGDVGAAIAEAPADRLVFRGGRLVASTQISQLIHRH